MNSAFDRRRSHYSSAVGSVAVERAGEHRTLASLFSTPPRIAFWAFQDCPKYVAVQEVQSGECFLRGAFKFYAIPSWGSKHSIDDMMQASTLTSTTTI